jgi:hypothetical protein
MRFGRFHSMQNDVHIPGVSLEGLIEQAPETDQFFTQALLPASGL